MFWEIETGEKSMKKLVAIYVVIHISLFAQEYDFSPEKWSDFTTIQQKNFAIIRQKKPLVRGKKMAVSGTSSPFSVRAGMEVLQQGGSALDAAYTTSLTQIALSVGCWNSYAGILKLMYYEASSGKVYHLDAGFNTPLNEKNPLTIPKVKPSGRTALVPGFMRGIEEGHKKFGKIPFAQLFVPAMYIAKKGFTVDYVLDYLIRNRKDVLLRFPQTKKIFTNKDGSLLRKDQILLQPDLLKTLENVAKHGAKYMYEGAWAQEFVEEVQKNGGHLTLEDLKNYRVTWSDPLQTSFHGATAFAPPTLGGQQFICSANLLDKYLENRSQNTVGEELFWLIKISRMGQILPYFTSENVQAFVTSPHKILDKEFAAVVWKNMQNREWLQKFESQVRLGKSGHSDAVVAIDREGNIAALTHTINTNTWGNTGLFIEGISIPDAASFQQQRMQQAGPGGRILNEIVPLIFVKNGKPVLACSSIGSGLHEETLQCVYNILCLDLDPKQAIEKPKFSVIDYSNPLRQVITQTFFSEEVLNEVRKLGQPLSVLPWNQTVAQKGQWVGIKITSDELLSGNDMVFSGYSCADSDVADK